MAQDAHYMKADKALEADIMKCTTPEEIQQLLANAVERSGIADRDAVTGRFIPRTAAPDAAAVAAKAAADAAAEPKEFKQTVKIAGQDFDFTANSAEALQLQIDSARTVAVQLSQDASTRSVARNAEREAMDRVDADMALRRGEISPAKYLERTHAIEDYLAAQGVDVAQISSEQFEQSWAQAGETFRSSAAGNDWPGGKKNQELIGLEITALGLADAPDKVAALAQAYERLKSRGMLFDGDHDAKEMNALTDKMSPQEILEAWKSTQNVTNGDATNANEEFIRIHNGGSGIFDR
jgi:hypothetical protein